MGIAALPFLATAAVGGIIYGATRSNPPAPTPISRNEQISSTYKPINFTKIMDELTGDQLSIVRNVNNEIALNFSNKKPFKLPEIQPLPEINLAAIQNLPEIRQIRGREVNAQPEIVVLNAAMTRLGAAIEVMESTSPYLIPQNQELITSYKTAVTQALDKGFDFKQQSIDKQLTKLGLVNSSSALGVSIALAREKADAYAEAELKQAELAQSLKQQSLANLNQRANFTLDQFKTETANQTQFRNQDMQADLATQELAQRRALEINQLEQQRALEYNRLMQQRAIASNQLEQQRALETNNIYDRRRNIMSDIGRDLFNSQNQAAINARQVDNNRIGTYDQTALAAYTNRPRNPFLEAGFAVAGQSIAPKLNLKN